MRHRTRAYCEEGAFKCLSYELGYADALSDASGTASMVFCGRRLVRSISASQVSGQLGQFRMYHFAVFGEQHSIALYRAGQANAVNMGSCATRFTSGVHRSLITETPLGTAPYPLILSR